MTARTPPPPSMPEDLRRDLYRAAYIAKLNGEGPDRQPPMAAITAQWNRRKKPE